MANSADTDEMAHYISSESSWFAKVYVLVCRDEKVNWKYNSPPKRVNLDLKYFCSQMVTQVTQADFAPTQFGLFKTHDYVILFEQTFIY